MPGQDPLRIYFGPWSELPNGDLMRVVYVPSAWRILPAGEANVPGDLVPSCPECGAPFAEEYRHGILLRFEANCMDKHDPASPPKRPRRETHFALSDTEVQRARDTIEKMRYWDLEEDLASRLNMHSYDLGEIISGRREPDASLRARIAAALEAIGCGESPQKRARATETLPSLSLEMEKVFCG